VRRGYHAKVAARNGALLERIRAFKAEHRSGSCRRVWRRCATSMV
jgi:hypothetical protein